MEHGDRVNIRRLRMSAEYLRRSPIGGPAESVEEGSVGGMGDPVGHGMGSPTTRVSVPRYGAFCYSSDPPYLYWDADSVMPTCHVHVFLPRIEGIYSTLSGLRFEGVVRLASGVVLTSNAPRSEGRPTTRSHACPRQFLVGEHPQRRQSLSQQSWCRRGQYDVG